MLNQSVITDTIELACYRGRLGTSEIGEQHGIHHHCQIAHGFSPAISLKRSPIFFHKSSDDIKLRYFAERLYVLYKALMVLILCLVLGITKWRCSFSPGNVLCCYIMSGLVTLGISTPRAFARAI
jgi:hypothetical protein